MATPKILKKKVFSHLVFVTCMTLFGLTGVQSHAEASTDKIQYVNDTDAKFTATLEPDPAPGTVVKDSNLVKAKADGNLVTSLTFSDVGEGKAEITGKLLNLEEGPHSATIETYHPDKILKDRKQLLFIVDTTPPELELVLPLSTEIPQSRAPFVVRYTDAGSGVAGSIQESGLKVMIADKEAGLLLHPNTAGGGRIVILPSSANFESDTSISLSLNISDRAGNIATLNKSFAVKSNADPEWLELDSNKCPDSKFNSLSVPTRENIIVRISKDLIFFGSDLSLFEFPIDFSTIGDCDGYSNTDVTKAIWEEISLSTTSQALRLTKHDFIEGTNQNKTLFTLSRVGDDKSDSTLSLRYPSSMSIEKDSLDACSYYGDNQCDLVVPGSAISFEYEEITIPVQFEQIFQSKLVVAQQNHTIVATEKAEPSKILDPAQSFFEVNSEKYWFNSNNQATAPAVEGLNEYEAIVGSSFGQWAVENDKSSLVSHKGSLFVAFAPPVIRDFHYDREKQKFFATLSDDGTPLSELDISITAVGFDSDPSLDIETGKLEAQYPLPLGIRHAYLYVRDNAHQLSKAQTIILGAPDTDPKEQSELDSFLTGTQSGESVKFNTGNPLSNIEILSRAMDGTLRYRECNTFTPVMFQKSRQDVDCNDMGDVEELDKGMMTTDWQTMTPTAKKSLCRRLVSHWPEYEYVPMQGGSQPVKICSDILFTDIKAPVISDISHKLDGDTITVTALIHDHGKPLSEITTEFIVRKVSASAGDNDRAEHDSNLEFVQIPRNELNPLNGTYTAEFLLPAAGLEIFDITITARDKADNSSWVDTRLTIPRFPPEVELTVLEGSDSSNFQTVNGQAVDVQLIGNARDRSGIDWYQTKCWINNHFYAPSPKKLFSDYAASFQEAGWENGTYSASFIYGAQLMEGNHTARFQATDNVGLSAEVEQNFLINYLPSIREFKTLPKAIQEIGGPAFTAMIFDRGLDVDSSGIDLFVNNQLFETDKLFYDPTSGYFSVDGPLELPRGIHSARLVVVDTHGNKTEKALRFAIGEEIAVLENEADIRIDDITIWELMNQNGDGQTNPGEYIRLFISLYNDSMVDYGKCFGQISPEDERIVSETEKVTYYNLLHNEPTFSLQGFDLQIDQDILSTTLSDPYETYLNLEVHCGEEEWVLPFILPIYRPSIPTDINSAVKIQLDRLPYTTSEQEIRIEGTATSSHSFIEQVDIFINGQRFNPQYLDKVSGRFEAMIPLQEGNNIVEVQAVDSTGAMGRATARISLNNTLIVSLDSLVKSTTQDTINITGSVESNSSISGVTVRVNGTPYVANYNSGTQRFSISVALNVGANTIEAEGTDQQGNRAMDSGFITRTIAFTPPSINIITPANGSFYQCNPIVISGTFDTGSSMLSSLIITSNSGLNRPLGVIEADSFSEEIGVIAFGGNYTFTATLETVDGATVSTTRTIVVGNCF